MARLPPLRRIQSTNVELNQLQDNLKAGFDILRNNPLSGAKGFGKVKLAAGNNLVQHGLGRAYQSVFAALLAGAAAASSAYGVLYNQSSDAQTLSLPTANTFVQSPQNHAGASSGMTLTTGATGNATITAAGTYRIAFCSSIKSATGAGSVFVAVYINGVQQADLIAKQAILSTSQFMNVPISGIRTFNANDVVDIRWATAGTGATLTLDSTNLSLDALPSAPLLTLVQSPDPTTYIRINATAACVVDLLVT